MSTANSMYAGFGGLSLPLDAADVTDGLSPLDPAKATLAALFTAAINAELGDAWSKLFTAAGGNAAGLASTHPLYDSTPVGMTLELEPTPQIVKQYATEFPLLCVHRNGTGVYEQHTLHHDRLTQPWLVHYILSPLDVGDARKFLDVCVAVAKVIRLCIRQRGHLSYQSGALQFFPGTGTLAAVDLKSHEGPGQAAFAGDETGLLVYAITMTLETVELTSDVEGVAPDLEGASFEVGVGGGEGILPGLVYADTAAPI